MKTKSEMQRDIAALVGKRCRDFEPGCPVCDMWEAYDLGAFGAVRSDIAAIRQWLCDEAVPS